jgi:hypothetical protein
MQASNASFNQDYAYFYDMFYEKKNYRHELDCIKKVLPMPHRKELIKKAASKSIGA